MLDIIKKVKMWDACLAMPVLVKKLNENNVTTIKKTLIVLKIGTAFY